MKNINLNFKTYLLKITLLFLFCSNTVNSQSDIQVEIVGGAIVYEYDTISITAGNAITFRITNTKSSCANVKIEDLTLDPSTGFTLSHEALPKNIKPEHCRNGDKFLDFTVTNVSGSCNNSTDVSISMNSNNEDFVFTFTIQGSPEINILGGDPYADIIDGSNEISSTIGTYFGVVEEGVTVSRNYIITSTGSCPLDVTSITSSLSDFSVVPLIYLPDNSTTTLPASIDPGYYVVFIISFTAPATPGTYTSTISVDNTDNTTFTFDVSAEIFDFDIPGPGGITADFRLWLKSTRGVTESSAKVSSWKDIGTNGKDATQPTSANQPTYLDTEEANINFNPVIKFENDGASLEQYLYNDDNGFYSQDQFIVMIPDATMTSSSSRNTIFAGLDSGSAGDITGVGFGDYSSEFTNETLSYNQDIDNGGTYNGEAELNSSYSNAGIINVRNNADPATGEEILFNSHLLTTSSVNDESYENVGYTDPSPPNTVFGTKYWIGRNFDVQGSLNGRVAEIFTFAERVSDADRQKIESYLAIKYGITLGASTEAEKDYINSFGTTAWDITANAGYNYHVAGIGKDSISDLNQKQSKTINLTNEVTIGLKDIFSTNNANINEFNEDGDFLVWGNNNGAFTGSSTNNTTLATGITTSLTRIDRKWKIVETTENSSDVESVYVSIPLSAFDSFSKLTTEEYALIVADNGNFNDQDIIDVIPLKSDGGTNLETWYDFDDTKYFTFGKTSVLSEDHAISFSTGDYLVGENYLNLNINAFTISAWIKSASSSNTRTIMAKGSKLQLRLNSLDQVEVMLDDDVTPRFTSSMVLDDNKWHQITFVYNSGTIFLYVDGVLDKSEQNVNAPSPNYNHFSVGALFIDKDNIINPFLGEIDELYIWDQGLTESQVRYLMNQEIEKTGTDYVTGKTLPSAATSNEVASIPWSQLRGYYDFNSFYGSAVEGLADNGNFLRLKYLAKDKTLIDSQTIPAPYVSKANGEWGSSSTWVNGSDNVLPNALSLDGTTYIDWNIVETTHDILSGDRDIAVLAWKNNSGDITIADPNDAQDETNSGQALTISHYLELDGVIDLIGESQLIQSEGSIIDADSGGYIERDQQGTANSFNYNYWSSSVGPISGNTSTRGIGVSSTNANHTISNILFDGTTSSSYQNITFSASYSAADSSTPTNPRTLSTYWFYTFNGADDDISAWTSINELSSLLPGEGYTMKGTSGDADILSEYQNYVFKGIPNNGDITLPLNKTSGDVSRLVGNPYPSAIDATEFILDNLSTADGGNNNNGTIFNGALYFWDSFGEENSHNLKDYVGGYATRNLTGGVAAISNDPSINNTSDGGNPAQGTKVPAQYIPVNQGFFVTTAIEGFDNAEGVAITTVDGGDIVFKNSQRVFVTEEYDSLSIFMRNPESKGKITKNREISTETPMIRLMFDSPGGFHRPLALGVNKKATKGFDFGYDAFMADTNEEDMYWIIDENKFVIQGVANFNTKQEFLLGIIIKNSGLARISLDLLENMDANMALYIKDNVTGKSHQINDKHFEIYLESGNYKDRFSLVFQNTSREVQNRTEIVDDFTTYYDSDRSLLHIILKEDTVASKASLLDFSGQNIKCTEVISNNIAMHVNVNKGLYIVQLLTKTGIKNKKIIID